MTILIIAICLYLIIGAFIAGAAAGEALFGAESVSEFFEELAADSFVTIAWLPIVLYEGVLKQAAKKLQLWAWRDLFFGSKMMLTREQQLIDMYNWSGRGVSGRIGRIIIYAVARRRGITNKLT